MKAFILSALLLWSVQGCAQVSGDENGEFPVYANGLIYDESTMSTLKKIVDSLNLQFKTCEPKTFKAFHQGYARHFVIRDNKRDVKKALDSGISPEDLLKRFPSSKENARHYIYAYKYEDYRNKPVTSYSTLPLRVDTRTSVEVYGARHEIPRTGWVYEDGDEAVYAFFLENLEAAQLSSRYTKLVQYVDCLIDTTAEIYLQEDRPTRELPQTSAIITYLDVAMKFKGEPKMDINWKRADAESKYAAFRREYDDWNNRRLKALDEKMKQPYYKDLLQSALNEAMENKTGDPLLEFYVARYLSREDALYLKRLRRPVGMCSMDQTPRLHAAEICKLAAETAKWDIFLRSHLNIMNDYFDRATDGSYAWEGRNTYLRELEMLDIHAEDLLIGASLRSSNTSAGHYYGDISRIGRAFSESANLDALKERLLNMVRDEELDLFNRLLMAYLFDNHNYYLTDEEQKRQNKKMLADAVKTMPEFIARTFKE